MATVWLLAVWLSALSMWALPMPMRSSAVAALRCAGMLAALFTLAEGAAQLPIYALMAVVSLAALSRLLHIPPPACRASYRVVQAERGRVAAARPEFVAHEGRRLNRLR